MGVWDRTFGRKRRQIPGKSVNTMRLEKRPFSDRFFLVSVEDHTVQQKRGVRVLIISPMFLVFFVIQTCRIPLTFQRPRRQQHTLISTAFAHCTEHPIMHGLLLHRVCCLLNVSCSACVCVRDRVGPLESCRKYEPLTRGKFCSPGLGFMLDGVGFGRVAGAVCAENMGDRAKFRRAKGPFALLITGVEQLFQDKANDLWNRQRVLLDPFSNFKRVTSCGNFG